MSLNLEALQQAYQLDNIEGELIALTGGSLHQVWRVNTTSTSYVLKHLQILTPQDEKQLARYRNTAAIAHLFLRMGLPAVPAKLTTNKDVLTIQGDQVYMLYPWVDGKVVYAHELSVDRSVRVATCLAMMHQLNLNIPAAEPWQFQFDQTQWQDLLDNAPAALKPLLTELLPDMQACHQVYVDDLEKVMTDIVISHRDMHAPNVLWTSSMNFQLIDWDLAGKTPAATDLLYVLLDWSLERRVLNLKKFTAMLCAYTSVRPLETQLTEAIVNAVLLNWLNWVKHQLTKLSESSHSLATKTLIGNEIRHSLLSYQVVREKTEPLCTTWNALISN